MDEEERSSADQTGAASGDGEPQKDPKQDEPKMVPAEDVNRLKSVYDTRVTEKNTRISSLEQANTLLNEEIAALKAEKPADQLAVVKREADIKRKEAMLDQNQKDLLKRGLTITARELLAEYEIKDMTVDELVALGSENEIELAILRKKTTPTAPPPNVPPKSRIDSPRGPSGASTDSEGIADAIKQAKKGLA